MWPRQCERSQSGVKSGAGTLYVQRGREQIRTLCPGQILTTALCLIINNFPGRFSRQLGLC